MPPLGEELVPGGRIRPRQTLADDLLLTATPGDAVCPVSVGRIGGYLYGVVPTTTWSRVEPIAAGGRAPEPLRTSR